MIDKRGQGWGFDLVVGIAIFLLGISAFFLFALNYNTSSEDIMQQMTYDGEIISSNLLSEGFPTNWDDSNVVSIGITTENKVDEEKLEKFFEMDYDKTRRLFNTDFNYFFNFSTPMIIEGNLIPGIGSAPTNQKNLIKTTRFTIYKDKPVSLNVYVWN